VNQKFSERLAEGVIALPAYGFDVLTPNAGGTTRPTTDFQKKGRGETGKANPGEEEATA